MSEKERPEWWPDWNPNQFPPFSFDVQVWDAACQTMAKAVIERIEAVDIGLPSMSLVQVTREEWQQLRKEVGLDD